MPQTSAATRAALTYQKHDIETADPIQLVVRVFELASRHLRLARKALAAGDPAAKGKRIHEASRCLSALQSCLDMERGDEVARNLDLLYGYWQRRLTEGHLHNDDAVLAEVAEHVAEVGAAWREILERQRSATHAEAAP
jgi:flagellar protein FliS